MLVFTQCVTCSLGIVLPIITFSNKRKDEGLLDVYTGKDKNKVLLTGSIIFASY